MTSLDSEQTLRDEAVREAWDENPALALLRSYSGPWVLPLFSQHLEFADAPVSADWFHQKVADVLDRNPQWAGEVAPAEHCKKWVDNRWLLRSRSTGRDGRVLYRLSQHSLRALRLFREVVEQENTVSEARLGSISHAVKQLADMTDPSREAQLARLDAQIETLRQRREDIAAGRVRAATTEEMARQLREVLRLTASLPEDFRQLSAMVEQRHREVARRASVDGVTKGAVVEEYLRQNDLLEQTPEGRAYRGFAQLLTSRDVSSLREDIDQVLQQPFARQEMSERQRAQLDTMISTLLAEEHTVQETYLRWTSSLRRFLTRSAAGRHQRLLTLAEQALQAGHEWVQRTPRSGALPDVLGIGPLDVQDISQVQLWRDPGPRTVEVVVESHSDALPEADRAALRLAAGTSATAVAATINALLTEEELVTADEVWNATPAEFQRLGTVLSLLDLAVIHGQVGLDAGQTVQLRGEHGQVLEVSLPATVFHTPVPDRAVAK